MKKHLYLWLAGGALLAVIVYRRMNSEMMPDQLDRWIAEHYA